MIGGIFVIIREDAMKYVENSQQELIELIKELCAIPAFSRHEEKRAAFIKEWFAKFGCEVFIDENLNVILPVDAEGKNELTIFMAHTDTVFPDEIGFECIEKDGWLCAPGVGDDTTNLAQLMLIARYIVVNKMKCPKGAVIVFNSCEEGLGNLDGSRKIMDTYKGRVHEFYSFDGGFKGMVNKSVGSTRYRVTVKTEGGHSYGAFGNRNAIAYASSMICTLYDFKVPNRGKSTYNVGTIEGGTSVNTIAQEVSFLFEYRSDDREDLNEMKAFFDSVIQAYQKMGITVEVEIIGERPCMGDVDENHMKQIIAHVSEVIEYFTHETPGLHSGSTDCNIPYAIGVAGTCFGGYSGKGAHTREEKVEIASLEPGMKIVTSFVLDYFE